jgi:nitroreductase
VTTLNEFGFDLEMTDRLLTTTRAVRRRLDLDRPVPRDLLMECIAVAQQAPTAGNSQGWRFVIVDDLEQRRALAQAYRDGGLQLLHDGLASAGDDQTRRTYESALYLADNLERVPVLVVPCIVGLPDAWGPDFVAGVFANILPATWSFMLALRSRGLGSCWTTSTLARQERVAEILGLPADVTQVALVPVAYHQGTTFSPAKRPSPDTIVAWNHWDDLGRPPGDRRNP